MEDSTYWRKLYDDTQAQRRSEHEKYRLGIARDETVMELAGKLTSVIGDIRIAMKTLDPQSTAAQYLTRAIARAKPRGRLDPVTIEQAKTGATQLSVFLNDSRNTFGLQPTEEQLAAFRDLTRFVKEVTEGTNE